MPFVGVLVLAVLAMADFDSDEEMARVIKAAQARAKASVSPTATETEPADLRCGHQDLFAEMPAADYKLTLSPGPDTRHCQADSSPTAPTTPDNARHPTTRQCHVVSHWDEACPVVKLSTRHLTTTRQGPDSPTTPDKDLTRTRPVHMPSGTAGGSMIRKRQGV